MFKFFGPLCLDEDNSKFAQYYYLQNLTITQNYFKQNIIINTTGDGVKILIITIIYSFIYISPANACYGNHQIGSEWGKSKISRSNFNDPFFTSHPHAKLLAESTAYLTWTSGADEGDYLGSAILLGEFNNRFIMATNSHLIHEKGCSKVKITFTFLERIVRVRCTEVIVRDEEVDFALIAIDPSNEDIPLLRSKGVNFSYESPLIKGKKLYTIGFSPEGITGSFLTRDNDCRILSPEINFIRNPKKESENFKPRFSYSFATGCDTFSYGDCGAVYTEEDTGKIIGMYWTEGTKNMRQPNIVRDILESTDVNPPGLWTDFTYGVPAKKIKERMLQNPLAQEPEYKDLFEAIFK